MKKYFFFNLILIMASFLVFNVVLGQEESIPTSTIFEESLGIAAEQVFKEEEKLDELKMDEEIKYEDLEVTGDARILPDSFLYPLKNFGRGIDTFFTFDPVKKAEKELDYANKKIMESHQLVEKKGMTEKVAKAIEKTILSAEKDLEDISDIAEKLKEQKAEDAPKVEKFLDKIADHTLKQQKVIERLEEKLPEEVMVKVQEAKEKALEHFGDVMIGVAERHEEITERITKIMDEQEGSNLKDLKNLEVLEVLKEKVPEEAREAIEHAKENRIKVFQEKFKEMPEEVRAEKVNKYLGDMRGNALRQFDMLDDMKRSEWIDEELMKEIDILKDKMVKKFETKFAGFKEVTTRDTLMSHLVDGDPEDLRILEQIDMRMGSVDVTAPDIGPSPEVREAMQRANDNAVNKFKDRFANDTEALRRSDAIQKALENPDAIDFRLLDKVFDSMPLEQRDFADKLRKEVENKMMNIMKAEPAKIDRFIDPNPESIEILKNLRDRMPEEERFYMERAMNEQVDRMGEYMRRMDDQEMFDRMKHKMEVEITIKHEIEIREVDFFDDIERRKYELKREIEELERMKQQRMEIMKKEIMRGEREMPEMKTAPFVSPPPSEEEKPGFFERIKERVKETIPFIPSKEPPPEPDEQCNHNWCSSGTYCADWDRGLCCHDGTVATKTGECIKPPQPSPAEPVECSKEGEVFDNMYEPDAICCAGLTKLGMAFPTEPIGKEDSCAATLTWEQICTRCGDGICGLGENWCICLEDCPKPAEVHCATNTDCGTDSCGQGRNICHEYRYTCQSGICSSGSTERENYYCFNSECIDSCGDGVCEPPEIQRYCPEDCGEIECLSLGERINPSLGPEYSNVGKECCGGLKLIQTENQFDENCNPILLVGAGSICASCGNGICGEMETKCNCREDCSDDEIILNEVCFTSGGYACGTDGDTQLYCEPSKMRWQFSQYCSTSNRTCENGNCQIICGDGICGAYETADDCPGSDDCGAVATSTPVTPPSSYCGDGTCDSDETETLCTSDCRGNYCGGIYCPLGKVCADAASRTCCESDEYFCNNTCSTTDCALPECEEGAIPSTGCVCQGINKFEGNCCYSYLSNQLQWTTKSCTQTCASIGGVCCLGGSSDCDNWSSTWGVDCQGYTCCSGTCIGKIYHPETPTCSAQGGSVCTGDEECVGTRVGSGDSVSCCLGACAVEGSNFITVTSPGAGAQLTKGNTYNIQWNYGGWEDSQYVHIDVCNGNGCFTLFSQHDGNLVSSRSVAWTIGSKWPNLVVGNDWYLRVFLVPINWTEGVDYDKSDYFSIIEAITYECSDTDGGRNYEVKGNAQSSNQDVEGRVDCCKLNYTTNLGDPVAHAGPGGGPCVDGPYLYEAYCEAGNHIPQLEIYECPGGCQNGVCVSEGATTTMRGIYPKESWLRRVFAFIFGF